MELTYLASPYSSGGAGLLERQRRFEKVCKIAAALMRKGENIFCPIAHSHPIEIYGMTTVEGHDFWLKQDFAVLAKCTKMVVVKMATWEQSVGIARELALAKHIGIPIAYVTEEEALDA